MDLSKIDRYLNEGITNKRTSVDILILEKDMSGVTPIERISECLDENLNKLEHNKGVAVDILMDFKRLSKNLKENIINTHKGVGITELNEKMYGFGTNGTVEVYGNAIILSKNGRSIELTKQELVDVLLKMGIAKKKVK